MNRSEGNISSFIVLVLSAHTLLQCFQTVKTLLHERLPDIFMLGEGGGVGVGREPLVGP